MAETVIRRETTETRVEATVSLEGTGISTVSTGIGFFDHMLTQVAKHGLFDLRVRAVGDLEVDAHHTVEDVGICLGQAFLKAVGDPSGLVRYGHAVLPMDDAMAEVAVDFGGRPYLYFEADLTPGKVGEFDVALTEEFFRAFAMNSRTTLHILLRHGTNSHHCIEIIFKAFARALSQALSRDSRVKGVPSTKGMLQT